MLLSSPCAFAGSYALASSPAAPYSGTGAASAVNTSTNPATVLFSNPYSSVNGYWGGTAGTTSGPTTQVSCAGGITAHFVWTPAAGQTLQTDPPPAQCLIQEDCSVSWQGVSGSGSNGVGGAVTGTSANGGQSGTKYSLKSSPGASFDWPATGNPTCQAYCPSPYGSALASLKYRVAAIVTNASLKAHSTVDTSGWDGANPRFFSGTNCSTIGNAVAVSGYVRQATLLIGGTEVKYYYVGVTQLNSK